MFADSRQTVFVLDVPHSLEHANGGGQIFSSLPANEPYMTPEPEGRKREAFEAGISVDEKLYHEEKQLAIEKELKLLHDHKLSRWCLPRALKDLTEMENQKLIRTDHKQEVIPAIVLSTQQNCFQFPTDIQNVLVCHRAKLATEVLLTEGECFKVPSNSSFIWSSIQHASLILANSKCDIESDVLFDLILMDPPWPNRSVRHARAYHMADAQKNDPFDQALQLVTHHLKEEGLVAIWNTNKWAILQHVLSRMAERGFVLAEQWIWTKVTTKGEPVTPLQGLWRKPYEILLMFRRTPPPSIPTLRYIFAVPDLHSRKPNLKLLFDMLFAQPKVLELFARNLTSGWTAVGDEVLKFQNNKMWSQL